MQKEGKIKLVKYKTFAQVWQELEDVPFDENEEGELVLAEDWYIYPKGVTREYIWHNLEDLYGVVIGDLL